MFDGYPDDLLKVRPLSEEESEGVFHDQMTLGQRAREVVENPAFELAFEQLRAHLLTQWQLTDATGTARREALWHQMQAATLFKENLVVMIDTGKVARTNLDMMERNSKVKQFLKKVNN